MGNLKDISQKYLEPSFHVDKQVEVEKQPTKLQQISQKYLSSGSKAQEVYEQNRQNIQDNWQKGIDEYNLLPNNPDFATTSLPIEGINNDRYKLINGGVVYGDPISEFDNAPSETRFEDDQEINQMNETERRIYTHLYNQEGQLKADEYIRQLQPILNKRRQDKFYNAETQEGKVADMSNGQLVGGNIASVGALPMSAVSSVDIVGQKGRQIVDSIMGRTQVPIDYNTPAQAGTNYRNAIREETSSRIENPITNFLYQTGMSIADSTVGVLLASAGIPNPGLLLGMDAGIQSAKEAKARGLSDNEALLTGLFAGIAEEFFEEYSIDRLLTDGLPIGGKAKFINMLKQMGVEGSEEVFTSIANRITDGLVNADRSQIQQDIQKLVAQGYTLEEARKEVEINFAKQLALDFLGGAVSGGVFGFGANINSDINAMNKGSQYIVDDVKRNQLINESTALGGKSQEYASKIKDDNSLKSRRQLGYLESLNQYETTNKAVEKAQNDYGMKADTMTLRSLQKQANGENLTPFDEARIKKYNEQYQDLAKRINKNDVKNVKNFVSNAETTQAQKKETIKQTKAFVESRKASDIVYYKSSENELKVKLEAMKLGETIRNTKFANELVSRNQKIVYDVERFKGHERNIGFYDTNTNEIVLNPLTSFSDQMRFVTAHEIIHDAKAKGKQSYDDLVKMYLENEVKYEGTPTFKNGKLVNDGSESYKELRKLLDLKKKESELYKNDSDEVLLEERVAKYIEDMAGDTDNAELIFKDQTKAKSFLERINGVINKFAGVTDNTNEQWKKLASIINKGLDAKTETKERFVVKDGLMVDSESGEVINKQGDSVADINEDGTAKFSLTTYDEGGRATLYKWLEDFVDTKQLSKEDAEDIKTQMEFIYKICKKLSDSGEYESFSNWSNATVVTAEDGTPLMSVVKANGEYALNLDFSLLCKKRRTLDAVLDRLVQMGTIDYFDFKEGTDIAKINRILREHEFETACALCFVDAKRFRQPKTSKEFVDTYNKLLSTVVPDGVAKTYFNFGRDATLRMGEMKYTPNLTKVNEIVKAYEEKKANNPKAGSTKEEKIALYLKDHWKEAKFLSKGDFISSQSFTNAKKEAPLVSTLYNATKGSGGPKASYGDVQYLGEILEQKKFNRESAYAVGGVRIQSFSDYVPRMVFDYVQMVADLSAKKLPAHAYTKEIMFAKQFGLTGIKINMSLIPKVVSDGIAPGLDKNGNYVFADESFGNYVWDEKQKKYVHQDGYAIAVEIQNAKGYSKNCGTICVGISDAHIRKLLNDKNIRMVIPYHKSGLNPIIAKLNNISAFYDYTDSQNTRTKDGKKLSKDNKPELWKEELNFNIRLQQTNNPKQASQDYLDWCAENDLIPRFDMFADEENYYKLLEDFTLYDVDGNYAPQQGVTMTFPTENDAFGSMANLIKEGLQEDAILEGKRNKEVPVIAEQIADILKDKKKRSTFRKTSDLEDVNEFMKKTYNIRPSDTEIDSEGNELSKGQQEYFKDSKARNKNGNLSRMFHGTWDFGFTIFDSNYSDDKTALFFTDNLDTAKTYSLSKDEARAVSKDNNYIQNAKNSSIEAMAEEVTRTHLDGIKKARVVYDDDKAYVYVDYYNERKSFPSHGKYEAYNESYFRQFHNPFKRGVYSVYLNLVNPLVIDAEGNYWNKLNKIEDSKYEGLSTTRDFVKYAKDNGYDGVIFNNIIDNSSASKSPSNVMVAFDSNQVKSTDNKNPTSNPDIRYSNTQLDTKYNNKKLDQDRIDRLEQEYEQNLKHNDLDACERIVEIYGKTKGFDTKVYNGTDDFGWTKPNNNKFLFTSSSKNVADSYTLRLNDTYKIGKISDIKKNSLSNIEPKDYVKFAQDLFKGTKYENEYKNFEYVPVKRYGYTEYEFRNKEYWTNLAYYQFKEKIRRDSYEVFERYPNITGLYSLLINTDGFAEIDCKGKRWNEIRRQKVANALGVDYKTIPNTELTTDDICEMFKEKGYKGIKFKNILDISYGYYGRMENNVATDYIPFYPANQIKSADAITYDDNGNVIPLSERFNDSNNDIRWSDSTFNANSGYDGYSMSNRAREAYENGEMPLSKWTKEEILNKVMELNPSLLDDIKGFNAETLKKNLLKWSSWHHTSKYYNPTAFYSINENYLENLTKDEIKDWEIVKSAKPNIDSKDITSRADEIYTKLQVIFSSPNNNYKTFNGLFRAYRDGKIDIDKLYAQSMEDIISNIKENDSSRIAQWEKLPDGHWRKEYIDMFNNNIEKYIAKEHGIKFIEYADDIPRKEKKYQQIKSLLQNEDIRWSDTQLDENDPIYQELLEVYGIMPKGANRTNTVDVPKATPTGNVRRFAQSQMESPFSDKKYETKVKKAIADNLLSYKVEGDASAIDYANKTLADNKFEGALKIFNNAIATDNVDKKTMVLGQRLWIESAQKKDYDTMLDIGSTLAVQGTRAGQMIQSLNLIKKFTPQGQLMTLEKYVDQMNKDREKDPKVKKELEEATQKQQVIQKDIDKLQKKIDDKTKKNQLKEEQINKLNEEIAKLKEEYNKLKKQTSSDTAKIVRRNQKLQTLDSQIKQLTKNLNVVESHLENLDNEVNQMNELKKKLNEVKKTINKHKVTLDDATIQNILNAQTRGELDRAVEQAYVHIAEQVPSTWLDKWNAWRYMSMLVNPTTHIRNIVGNAMFIPAMELKNLITYGLQEKLGNKIGLDEKTTLKAEQKYKDEALKVFEENKNFLMSSGKYNANDIISENRRIFQTQAIELIRKKNGELLEAEDGWFLRRAFVEAYSRYLQANPNADKQKAFDYAKNEAWKATYRDASVLAEKINAFAKTNVATDVLVGAILPFKKTPINILKRGIEYSPIGLFKSVYDMTYGLKHPEKFKDLTPAKALDKLASKLSGTIIILIGMLLARWGLLNGKGDDESLSYEKQVTGFQPYSINFGKNTYTLDWASPTAMPLFVGVELHNALQGDFEFKGMLEAISNIPAPLFEMSLLSGMAQVIDATRYADSTSEKAMLMTSTALSSYLGQALPTLGRRLASIADANIRNVYYNNKNSNVPKGLQTFGRQAVNKTPFASKLLEPKIDVWGRELTSGGSFERHLEALVSPGYWGKYKATKVDEEIIRVYQHTADASVIPNTSRANYYKANKYDDNGKLISSETKYMDTNTYTSYSILDGRTQYNEISKLINTSYYKSLNDEEKAKAISDMYTYAKWYALRKTFSDYKSDTFEKTQELLDATGLTYAQYYSYKQAYEELLDARTYKLDKNGDKVYDKPASEVLKKFLMNSNLNQYQCREFYKKVFPTAKTIPLFVK